MTDLQRRALLTLGGTAALAPAALRAEPSTPRPFMPQDLWRQAWDDAPRLPLWPHSPPGAARVARTEPASDAPWHNIRDISTAQLRIFLPTHPTGASTLVIPGGGYGMVSVGYEGVDIAGRLTALGHVVFVLLYRLPAEGWSEPNVVPLQDAQRAMRVIRACAPRWGLDADRIAVMGFSAGGHLAATLATAHQRRVYAPIDAADAFSARPCGAALAYAVITMTRPLTHDGSRLRLLGEAPDDRLVAAWSAERLVDAATPPCFVAHACDDELVPVENSLLLVDALRKAQRPVEAHLFQEGRHAFGVGRPGTPSGAWLDLYASWLQRI